MKRYDVEAISKSSLPVGGVAKRLKISLDAVAEEKPSLNQQISQCSTITVATAADNDINFSAIQPASTAPCGIPFDAATAAFYHQNFYHHFQQPNFMPSSDTAGSSSAFPTPVTTATPQPSEFYIWPHHPY